MSSSLIVLGLVVIAAGLVILILQANSKGEEPIVVNPREGAPHPDALTHADVTHLVDDVSRELASIFPQAVVDPRFKQNIQTLINDFDPQRGRFWSWWLRGKAESRNKLLTAMNDQQRALIEQGAMLARHVNESQMAYAQTRSFVVKHAIELFELRQRMNLVVVAGELGFTLDNHQAVLFEREKDTLEAGREKRRHDLDLEGLRVKTEWEIKKEREVSQIRLKEHEERIRIELANRRTEYEQDQENVDRIQDDELETIDRKTKRLFRLYDERAHLMASDTDPAKEHKIRLLNKNIAKAEAELNVEED